MTKPTKTKSSKTPHRRARKPRVLPPKKKDKNAEPEITPLLATVLNLNKEHTRQLENNLLQRQNNFRAARQRHLQRSEQQPSTRQLLRRARWRELERQRWQQQALSSSAHRKRRLRKLTWSRLSRDQLLDERDAVRKEALARGDLNVKKGETTFGPLSRRLAELNEGMERLWRQHEAGIVDSEPRYLEGWPVRETLEAPRVLSARGRQQVNRLQCIQCQAMRLPCSRPYYRWKRGTSINDPVKACTRCVRNGKRFDCLTQVKMGGKFVLAECDADEVEREKNGLAKQEDIDARVDAVLEDIRRGLHQIVTDVVGSRVENVKTSAFPLPPYPYGTRLKRVW